jgi:membrane-bound inhibitor of C-type lysozyme
MCDSDSIHQTQRSDQRGSYQKDIKAKDQISVRVALSPKISSMACIKLKYQIKIMSQTQRSYQCHTSNPKIISVSYINHKDQISVIKPRDHVTSNPNVRSYQTHRSQPQIRVAQTACIEHTGTVCMDSM